MSSKVIKWFKRQASIRRFTEKKEDQKSSSGSKEPPEEKRKLSFGRLSFRRKHKRKPSSTTDLEGNLAIVGISKKYSHSLPNEMEDEKRIVSNGATNAVSLDNSASSNSPTKTDSTSKSVSELSYHSSFDNEAHSSEFSREFDNIVGHAAASNNMNEKIELDSDTSKFSDTFHTGLTSPATTSIETGTIDNPFSAVGDQADRKNSSNDANSLPDERRHPSAAETHPSDIRIDKKIIPIIVIETVPNKPPLAAIESYSSDDLSCLSEIDPTEMNKECDSIQSIDEQAERFKEIDSLLENTKSTSGCHVGGESGEEACSKSEPTNTACDEVSNADNDTSSVNSLDKSEEKTIINCVNDESVYHGNEEKLNKLPSKESSISDRSSSPESIKIKLQTCGNEEKIEQNGVCDSNTNVAPYLSSTQISEIQVESESTNLSKSVIASVVSDNTEPFFDVQEASEFPKIPENSEINEIDKDEETDSQNQPLETNVCNPTLKDFAANESKVPVHISYHSTASFKQFPHRSSSENIIEYPEELNPFGDDSEEENSKIYPSLHKLNENGSNPFGSDSESEQSISKKCDKSADPSKCSKENVSRVAKSSPSRDYQRKISSTAYPNKRSLNPFGDSEDEDTDDANGSNRTLCKDDIPPRLPPKSDLQKRKYSGSSLAPVPRPRKTKQYHGSTTSLQNVSSFPVPAPRSITPYGSTKTLNESISSANPFEEDEEESAGSFERLGLGRNTVQLQSTTPGTGIDSDGSFPRNGVRSSLPTSMRFRPRKKRQAPLPPGAVISKPPHSPMPSIPSSVIVGPRKRSSTSPASDVVFEVKPRGSKSPSPRRTPPPRPPLPSN